MCGYIVFFKHLQYLLKQQQYYHSVIVTVLVLRASAQKSFKASLFCCSCLQYPTIIHYVIAVSHAAASEAAPIHC